MFSAILLCIRALILLQVSPRNCSTQKLQQNLGNNQQFLQPQPSMIDESCILSSINGCVTTLCQAILLFLRIQITTTQIITISDKTPMEHPIMINVAFEKLKPRSLAPFLFVLLLPSVLLYV